MAVAVVTDTAASLPADLASGLGITVVPMWLTVDGEPVREGEIPLEELLAHEHVTTSGPTPGEYEAAVKALHQHTDDGVLVLTVASTMSGTHRSAVLGVAAAGGAVRVLDTTTAAGAQGLVVLAAAEAAKAGGSLDEVEAAARAAIDRVRLVAMVQDLDHLARSGRVPNIGAWANRRLGIVPLFEFRDGGAHAIRPARGSAAALDRILHRLRRDRIEGGRLHVAALHARAEGEAEDLLARVRDEYEPTTAFVAPFGSVMVVHTGPGVLGLAWRWEPPAG